MSMNLNQLKNCQSETWERFSWFGKWEQGLFPGDIFILEIWWGILEGISRRAVSNLGLELKRKVKVKAGDIFGSQERQ